MSPGNAFLALNVLIFACFGLAGLFAPEAMLAGAGVLFQPESSSIDLRATYGGMMLGFAGYLAACMGGTQVRAALAAIFFLMLGALGGRSLGLSLETGPDLMWQLAIVEAVWCLLAAWLWLRYPRQVRSDG